jgi:hypothetical protein
MQAEQIGIPCHDNVGPTTQRKLKKLIVAEIATYMQRLVNDHRCSRIDE